MIEFWKWNIIEFDWKNRDKLYIEENWRWYLYRLLLYDYDHWDKVKTMLGNRMISWGEIGVNDLSSMVIKSQKWLTAHWIS